MTTASTDRRQGLTSSAAIKVAVAAATTANISLSGEQTIDGVAVVTGDRVLVKAQTSGVDNGIYYVDTGTWTRAPDCDGQYDVRQGTLVLVLGGSQSGYWYCTADDPITIDTTALTWGRALYYAATDVEYTASYTGAVTRTVREKLDERITPLDFGAEGDNSTNDSAAFTLLEAARKGEVVDLLGRTYLVTSRPSQCNYFNGTFRVSSTTYPQPRNARDHPLDGPVMVINDSVDAHFWPGPVGQPSNDDIILRCYVLGWRHSVSIGAPLLTDISYDDGATWGDQRTIYAEDNREPRGLVGGMVTSTRFGVFFACLDSAGAIQETKFAYTDDNGETWTTVVVSTTLMYPHGEFVFDDSGGINVFGYGGNTIYRARSTDDGANWTITTAKAGASPITQPVEPTVVKVATGQYLMFVRNDAGGDMGASTSTDCATWTDWEDTNIPLGMNPPLALIDMGRLWVYLAARRSIDIAGYEDKLLVAELDPDDAYASGGAISGTSNLRICLAAKTAMIGYLSVARLRDGRYVGFMIDGETVNGSSNPSASRLIRLGGREPVLAAASILTQRRTRPPITHNSSFAHWTRGSSFIGLSAGDVGPDRWMVTQATGATVDLSRADVSDALLKVLPNQPRYAMRVQSAVGGSGRAIGQRFYGRERVAPMLNRVVTMTAIVGGTCPGYFRSRIDVNFGGGGSSGVNTAADAAQRSVVGDLTIITATHYTPNGDGVTWGTDPYMTFGFFQNDAGAIDCNIYGLWWDWGDASIPLDPVDYDAERTMLDKYCQRLSYGASDFVGLVRGSGSANVEIGIHLPAMMIATPTFTADSSTNLLVGITGLTSATFDLASPQAARMVGVLSSGTLSAGAASLCQVTTGNTWFLLADVGH